MAAASYSERSVAQKNSFDYELAMVELRRWLAALAFLAVVVLPRTAAAQLHWDASVQVGAMKRLLVERPQGSDDAGFGPVAQLTAHLALLPLIHAGIYAAHDISPLPDPAAARNITSGGLRGKLAIPLHGNVRAWAFLGFGVAAVYSQGYDLPGFPVQSGAGTVTRDAHVEGAGGRFFEVPLGIGASYKLRKPWELCAELGGRIGFAHSGSVYEEPGPQLKIPGFPDNNVLPAGLDRFAVGLTVGVMLDL